MHATTRNLVTCVSPGCHEPATVKLLDRRPTEAVTLAVNGDTYYFEQPAAIVDYCGPCAVEACEP